MAEAPSLGDFFKSKSKKKVKASNLNKAEEKKAEDTKVKKSSEDDAWQEEQVVAATMKIEVVGKLMREEEKKDDEDTNAPAWGNVSKSKDSSVAPINEKRFPTLAKSVGSSSINIDDGSDAKVNIATSKNVFAALEGEEDDDEGGPKRPKSIKPAMVQKKQGEREKVALQREVDKYATKTDKKDTKKNVKKQTSEDEDEEGDEEEEDEQEEEAAPAPIEDEAIKTPIKKKAREKSEEKKVKKPVEEEEEEGDQGELEEDLKIQVDLVKSKGKYTGRKKRPFKDLPRAELEEEKENKPKQQQQTSAKKKKFILEEDTEKKLQYADW